MIPQTTEERTAEYTATPEFRAASAALDKACGIATRYIPPFTNLQSASMQAVLQCVPQGIEFTARALFGELEDVIRDLRNSNESMEKDLVVVRQATEESTHNRVMRKKLCEFLKTVAHLVDEKFDPVTLPYPDREFITDRVICKLYRLLAPGNIKSWDVSGETATGSVSPEPFEPFSANWYRVKHQAAPQKSDNDDANFRFEVRSFLESVLDLDPSVDHGSTENLLAIAKERREFVRARTRPVAIGHDYDMQEEEIKELQFQNGELSRQLEAAQASEKQFRNELGLINNEIQPFREELFAAELTHVSIDYIVSRLVFAWNKYKAETFNATHAADIQAVQKERDELAELVSDIKLVLAKHLSDDPLFNIVPVAEIIDQKLAHLKAVSQVAHRLQMQEARLTLQAMRLSDAGIVSQVGADLAGMVQNLVSFRLGAEATEQQREKEKATHAVDTLFQIYKDGDSYCAVPPGFIDLQQSPSGWGDTPQEALAALLASFSVADSSDEQASSQAAATKKKDDDSDIQLPATPNVIPPSHEEFLRGCGILALTKGKRHCIPKFLGLRYGENPANAHECMRELCLSGTEWANFRNAGERIVTYCADKNLVKGTEERKDFDRVLAEFCDKADSIDGVKPAKREPKDF